MHRGLKILVAYDGSTQANHALSEAITLAQEMTGSVMLLRVQDAVHEALEAAREFSSMYTLLKVHGTETSLADSKPLLHTCDQELWKSGVPYEIREAVTTNIPQRIVRVAEEEDFDLIVMGARGLGGAKAWLLGSVSQRVVTEAPCPVLLVK
jgi:nucleotide-binding universal stress UspA family protein